MSKLLLLFSLIAAVAAVPSHNQLDGYTFENFLQDFDVNIPPSEMNMRREVFNAELARVRAHNAKNLSWKEGINKFSTMTASEKKALFGRTKNSKSNLRKVSSERSLPADFVMKPVSALPKTVDWRTVPGISTAIKDQGGCGGCWAFSSTAAIETYVAMNSGILFDLSVQQIAMCTPNPNKCGGSGGCGGATAELAFDFVMRNGGIVQDYQYGFNSYNGVNEACKVSYTTLPYKPVATIDGFVQLPGNNYTALMNAVATVGPVVISVDATTWPSYESGIYNGCNQEDPDIIHVVLLVGYGEENGLKYWIVRNSWAPSWGEKGFIRLLRTDSEETRCGMDTHPQDGMACAGDTEPVKACGTCGMLFDSVYPTGARAL